MDRSQRPGEGECSGYHCDYVAKVSDGDILATLMTQSDAIPAFIRAIPESESTIVHPPYGWSIHQVIEHCVEAERVFGYRILRFASGDKTDLPGWDENAFADSDYASSATLEELAFEYHLLRRANLCLLTRLNDDSWNQIGNADGKQISVRAVAWLMAGHWLHHEAILRKRLSRESELPSPS